jgi:hypothetical protein
MIDSRASVLALLATLAGGCIADTEPSEPNTQTIDQSDMVKPEPGKEDASYLAVFLDFEFDAEIVVSSTWSIKSKIEDQLLYTIGQLNGDKSVGRLDKVELTGLQTTSLGGGQYKVKYHARLPVAWGQKTNVPVSYTLELPRLGTAAGYTAFTDKYKASCVDWSAHDVTSGSMWYYFRPHASGCQLASEDIVVTTATVSPSDNSTVGKYPEYDLVWEDNRFEVIAIFGKYEDGATASSDAGIAAYNKFTRDAKSALTSYGVTSTPSNVPYSPGVAMPDITFTATIATGKTLEVTALLVDNVRTAGPAFDARYADLSGTADFIAYNGHAGLGANVRALAQKGEWIEGQYAIVFMNGCDTFAYIDTYLWDAHAAVNDDDPNGTKYLDIATNAMPSYFASTANATMTFIKALMNFNEPRTYEQIFAGVDSAQIVLVSGEEDNSFVPGGGGGGGGEEWEGMTASGTVTANQEKRWSTPVLAAGRYRFDLTGSNDADLYVRLGSAPTTSLYDCRPYKYGSNESCVVDVTTPVAVHVMVRGWASSSNFELVGQPE